MSKLPPTVLPRSRVFLTLDATNRLSCACLLAYFFFTRSAQLDGIDSTTPPSDEEARDLLARWIVRNDQPFAVVENAEFRMYINRIAPGIAVP